MRCDSDTKERMKDNNNFILSGRYEILKPLGCGSNGTVYLARHHSLGIDRAVKVFPKSDAQSPFAVSEAQVLKTVQHPGIPTIYDFEEDESFYYLVEEYIQGDSLEQFLLHQPLISRALFYQFCEQLCDIFSYLHSLSPSPILYQDLKPEHIIVCGLQIKLIDFSVASFITNSGNDFNHFGNAEFSAPELTDQAPPTLAADIYSIGRIIRLLLPHVDASISRNILPIIHKTQNADPRDRYQTVRQLSTALADTNDNTEESHLRLTIAVIGSHSGCGCTHVAISLVSTLRFIGHTAVYLEKNKTNHLRYAVRQMKQVWEKDGYYSHQCFQGYPKYDEGITIPTPVADILVEDYGNTYSLPELSAADYILYICGGGLWHRSDATINDHFLQQLGDRLKIIANLCDRKTALYYARKFSMPVYLYPYDADPFHVDRSKQDFIRWLSLQKGRKSLFLNLKNHIFRHLRR